jgi:hypothetical protein
LPKRVSIIAACFSTKLNNLKSKSGKDILLWTHENSLRKNQSSTPVSPQSNDGGKKLRLFPQKCPHHAPNIISQFWLTEEICNKPTSNLWDYKNQNHEVIDYFNDDQGCPTPPTIQFFVHFFNEEQAMWTNMGQETFFLGWFRNNLTRVSSLSSTSLTKPQLTLLVQQALVQQGNAASITLSSHA